MRASITKPADTHQFIHESTDSALRSATADLFAKLELYAAAADPPTTNIFTIPAKLEHG